MLWLLFLLLTIITWGLYNLFFKGLGDSMNYFLALLINGLVIAVTAVPFVIYYYLNGELNHSVKGIILSVLMGILLGSGTIFFFYTFKFNAPASVAIPIFSIGALIIGVIGGIFLFKEAISPRIIIGFTLGIISIFLLASGK